MIEFIKNYSLENIKRKFLLLYILNITDIAFTLVLYNTGLFTEVNFLIAGILNNPILSLLLKALIPGLLLLTIAYRIQAATKKQLRYSNIITNVALSIYLSINIMHLFYIAILPILIYTI